MCFVVWGRGLREAHGVKRHVVGGGIGGSARAGNFPLRVDRRSGEVCLRRDGVRRRKAPITLPRMPYGVVSLFNVTAGRLGGTGADSPAVR